MSGLVLVIGESGQLAQSLAEASHARGLRLVCLGQSRCDLSTRAPLASLSLPEKPAFIINAAAYTAVDQAEVEHARCMAINAEGAGQVADFAARLAVPLVHISTDYVFDGTSHRPYREDDTPSPLGVYGESKRAGEMAVAARHADHAILRTAWLFSPFGRNFVKTILAKGLEAETLRVVDDQIGSPTSALDLAEAALTIGAHLAEQREKADWRGIFHVVNAGEASWRDLAQAIREEAQQRGARFAEIIGIPTHEYPTPARRPANSRLDSRRLAERHGVTLPVWRDALARCMARLMAQP